MKAHVRKKAYRRMIHELAKVGYINLADGRMVPKTQAKDDSMKSNYYPQR